MKKIDITKLIGIKYGRLTLLHEVKGVAYEKGITRKALCRCDCGNEKIIDLNSLRKGKSSSCGCLNKQIATINSTTHGLAMLSPGKRHPDYEIWIKMKSRCYNSNDKSYKYYGGRGIGVCDEWRISFQTFIHDLGWRPNNNYSLERIDYNKNYCRENCKWILKSEQSKNNRRVKLIFYHEKQYCLTDLCKLLNLPYNTMRHRIYDLKIPFEEAIKYPQHYKFKNNKL